jgi:hypothetical protein
VAKTQPHFARASEDQRRDAAWDLQWEGDLGPQDQITIPEAIVFIAPSRLVVMPFTLPPRQDH